MNEKRQQLLPVFLEAWQRQKLCLRKNRKSSSILSSGLRILQQSLSIQIYFFRSHLQAKLERYGKTMKSWQSAQRSQLSLSHIFHFFLQFSVQQRTNFCLTNWECAWKDEDNFFCFICCARWGTPASEGCSRRRRLTTFHISQAKTLLYFFLNKVKRGRFLFKNTQQKDWSALQTNRQTHTFYFCTLVCLFNIASSTTADIIEQLGKQTQQQPHQNIKWLFILASKKHCTQIKSTAVISFVSCYFLRSFTIEHNDTIEQTSKN